MSASLTPVEMGVPVWIGSTCLCVNARPVTAVQSVTLTYVCYIFILNFYTNRSGDVHFHLFPSNMYHISQETSNILNSFLIDLKARMCENPVVCASAETGPETRHPLAAGGHPAALLLRTDPHHRPGLHGAHSQEEAPVGGRIQPQCSGGGGSSAGDGQYAQSATRGKTHLTPRPSMLGNF